LTNRTWITFVEAQYGGLVKAASTVVGRASAADAVQGALQRAAKTKSYLNCKTDPFTWVISAVTSVAARRPKPEHAARGVPKPRPVLGALVKAKQLDRQVAAQLAVDANNKIEAEAERVFNAETVAILARIRANRKVPQHT
jgi:DNA-directed RNA polymerase specialized sigma24 family protein